VIRHRRKPHTTRNSMAQCFIEPQLLPIKVLRYMNRDFGQFLFLWPWPWPDDLYIRTWTVSPGDMPDVRKLSYYRHADRKTDRHTGMRHRNYILRHFAAGQKCRTWNWRTAVAAWNDGAVYSALHWALDTIRTVSTYRAVIEAWLSLLHCVIANAVS